MGITSKLKPDRIYFFWLVATMVLLPWSLKLCTYAIIAMCIAGLFTTPWNEKLVRLKANKQLLVFPLLYTLFIIGLLYSPDVSEGLFGLEKKLALLAIPIIIGSSSFADTTIERKILMGFVYSNLLFSLTFLILNAYVLLTGEPFMNINFDVHTLQRFNESFNDANPVWMRFSYIALGTTDFGPTYQSLFAVFCVVILYFSDAQLSFTKWLMITWLTFIIILSASRTGFLVFLVVSSLGIYYKESFTLKGILSLGIFLTLVFTASLISPVSKFRLYVEPSTTEFFPKNPDQWNSISLRQMELVSGVNALKEYWPMGVGTGGTISALRQQYDKFNLGDFKYDYTSHNQYIQTFLEIGVAGILVLLACYIIPLRAAILQKRRLLLTVIIIMILTSCTTCILERSRGIIFFMTFASLFMIKKPDTRAAQS